MTGLLDPSQVSYCHLCKLCPAPLGVCCFVWAAGILLILILLLALTGRKYRCPVCGCRVGKRTKLCPDCGYNFITGEPPAYARHLLNDQVAAPSAAAAAAAYMAAAATSGAAANNEGVTPPPPPPLTDISAPAEAPAPAPAPAPAEAVAAAPAAPAVTCPHCGAELPAGTSFCIMCGQKLN